MRRSRNNQFPRPIRSDERGNVALIFALALTPAMVAIGAAIDYSTYTKGKAQVQTTTDAVALALAKTLTPTSTGDGLKTTAQNMLAAYSQEMAVGLVGSPVLSNNNGQLCISTTGNVTSTIASLLSSTATVVHGSTCVVYASGGPYEVALVLDNTGSMGNTTSEGTSKLDAAKAAAKALIAQLNPTGGTASATFSIVPFTTSVNVGTQYAGMSWLDTAGASSIHWQNYTRPTGASWLPTSRFDLFTQTGTTWAGCIEERPDPYLVTDTAANTGTPDTMYVPYLWPDEGDLYGGELASLPGSTFGSGRNAVTYGSSTYTKTDNGQNNYLYDFGGVCVASAIDKYEVADIADAISKGSGATKLCKYKGVSGVSSSVSNSGPNHNCISNPLLPLTQDITALNAKIDSMQSGGTTNLLPGFLWGWRTISSNGPFADPTTIANAPTGTQTPKAYTAKNNTKVIVFMTDGFNNWSSSNYVYGSEYNALGYYVNNRLSNYGGTTNPPPSGGSYSTNNNGPTTSSNWRAQMDSALLAACANAKNAGVIVFTVGFSIPGDTIDTEGLNLLRQCATSQDKAFVSANGTDILNAFKQIGIGLSNLRIKS